MSPRERQLAARRGRDRFAQSRRAEKQFAVRLRQIAKSVGHIVEGFIKREGPIEMYTAGIVRALGRYADLIPDWARATVARMHAEVDRRDWQAWKQYSREMGVALEHELRTADTGTVLRRLMSEQVDLITSLPREAGQRVHKLAMEGLTESRRSSEVVAEILRTGKVTESRATLIARTETARTSTMLTMARALAVGSEGYVWRTSRDGNVRRTHRAQAGKFIAWNAPPQTDKNLEPYHAGAGPNCRCWPEPRIPDDL